MADTMHKIECPACSKEMKKIYIEDANACVDICTQGCGGVYFDNREFEKFDEPDESIDAILAELEGKTFNSVDEREVRICPVCNVPMVKMGSGTAGVQIDVCNNCGAKFLDKDELQKIREGKHSEQEKLDNLIEDLYQREMKSMFGEKDVKTPVTKGMRVAIEKIVFKHLMR